MLYEALQSTDDGGSEFSLPQLFEGKVLNYVRCTRVKFRSEREERFCDLQMQERGRADACALLPAMHRSAHAHAHAHKAVLTNGRRLSLKP
eukprot:2160760-Pleurochrysis_carterae.AAC.1